MSSTIPLGGQDPKKEVGKPTIRQRRNKDNDLSVEVYQYPRRCLPRVVENPQEPAGITQKSLQQPPKLIEEEDRDEENAEIDKIVPPRTGVPLMIRGQGVQVYRFRMAKNILQNSVMSLTHILYRGFPNITELPVEILVRIFKALDTPFQICLALTNKSLAAASRYLNNGYGIYYSRGDRMRVLWRLSVWMGSNLMLCHSCEKYFSTSPDMWRERKHSGRSKTNNVWYGRIPEDFIFKEGACPECAAEKTWEWVNRSTVELQSAVV